MKEIRFGAIFEDDGNHIIFLDDTLEGMKIKEKRKKLHRRDGLIEQ